MKNFLLIYGANAQAFEEWENATEAQQEQEISEWTKWIGDNSENFVDTGNPVGANTRVMPGDKTEEKSNEIAGYSILKAEDKNKALEMIQGNPHTKTNGAYIELMEIVNME